MMRRDFIKIAGTATATAGLAGAAGLSHAADSAAPKVSQPAEPRMRGFNLLELFSPGYQQGEFREQDFEIMAEWGFNFARIPMSYWYWSKPDTSEWLKIDETPLKNLDRAVSFGKQYGIHVNLNLHRLPGYCINGRDKEPVDLFEGPADKRALALKAACHHWQFLARRYKGIPNAQLSFDLINEPPYMPSNDYAVVARALVEAIREIDPKRLIVSDGINVGTKPVFELADLGIMQSGRGYAPIHVSHYRAPWMPSEMKPGLTPPTWPMTDENGLLWDKETLRDKMIKPWKEIEAKGVKVHFGEWGSYNQTPHSVSLAWMKDNLDLWKEAGWGWSLWNLRGDFGPLNSTRADVSYEDFKGHKLDRKMLEILQAG